MVVVYHRITQLIIFVAELQHRRLQPGAFRQPQTLRQAACCLIAHDNLQRNNGYPFDGGLPFVEFFHIMGGNPLFFQQTEHIVGHLIVYNALSHNSALL